MKKNIVIPISTENKIFPDTIGRAIVSIPNNMLNTMLINKQIMFLHNTSLEYPLSEAPKIVIITNENKANTRVNASIMINSENTPKKYKIAKINAIITPSAILYKQLQKVLFIIKTPFK